VFLERSQPLELEKFFSFDKVTNIKSFKNKVTPWFEKKSVSLPMVHPCEGNFPDSPSPSPDFFFNFFTFVKSILIIAN